MRHPQVPCAHGKVLKWVKRRGEGRKSQEGVSSVPIQNMREHDTDDSLPMIPCAIISES